MPLHVKVRSATSKPVTGSEKVIVADCSPLSARIGIYWFERGDGTNVGNRENDVVAVAAIVGDGENARPTESGNVLANVPVTASVPSLLMIVYLAQGRAEPEVDVERRACEVDRTGDVELVVAAAGRVAVDIDIKRSSEAAFPVAKMPVPSPVVPAMPGATVDPAAAVTSPTTDPMPFSWSPVLRARPLAALSVPLTVVTGPSATALPLMSVTFCPALTGKLPLKAALPPEASTVMSPEFASPSTPLTTMPPGLVSVIGPPSEFVAPPIVSTPVSLLRSSLAPGTAVITGGSACLWRNRRGD